jgi:hypothetical protein
MRGLTRGTLIAAAAILAAWGFGSGVFYIVSKRPGTCTICHFEKPYYESWKSSTHSFASCVDCHPYPFKRATVNAAGVHNPSPTALVEDSSCLKSGCHQDRLKKSVTAFKLGIQFDHSRHSGKLARGERLKCTSCHSRIVQGSHMAVTEKVCYLCHFMGAERGQAITQPRDLHEGGGGVQAVPHRCCGGKWRRAA